MTIGILQALLVAIEKYFNNTINEYADTICALKDKIFITREK